MGAARKYDNEFVERAVRRPVDVITVVPSHATTRGGWDHMKALISKVRTWPGNGV
jgi:hypothetical protein